MNINQELMRVTAKGRIWYESETNMEPSILWIKNHSDTVCRQRIRSSASQHTSVSPLPTSTCFLVFPGQHTPVVLWIYNNNNSFNAESTVGLHQADDTSRTYITHRYILTSYMRRAASGAGNMSLFFSGRNLQSAFGECDRKHRLQGTF